MKKILGVGALGVIVGYKAHGHIEDKKAGPNIVINNNTTYNNTTLTSVSKDQEGVVLNQNPGNVSLSSNSTKTISTNIPINKKSHIEIPVSVNKKDGSNDMKPSDSFGNFFDDSQEDVYLSDGSSSDVELNSSLEFNYDLIDSYFILVDNLLGFKSMFGYFLPLIFFYLLYLKISLVFYTYIRDKFELKYYLINHIINVLKKNF